MTVSDLPKQTLFWLLILLGSLGFVIYEAIQTPYFSPFQFIGVGAILAIIWITRSEWNPVHISKNFITDSGVVGVVWGSPIPEQGGRITYKIGVYKRYVPSGKRTAVSGFSGLMAVLAGWNIEIIKITDSREMFRDIPSNNCEAPEGAVKYLGRLDGGPLDDEFSLYRLQIRNQSISMAQIRTETDALWQQVGSLAQQKTLDADAMSQYLKTIADRVKRIQIIQRGRGGMEDMEMMSNDET